MNKQMRVESEYYLKPYRGEMRVVSYSVKLSDFDKWNIFIKTIDVNTQALSRFTISFANKRT